MELHGSHKIEAARLAAVPATMVLRNSHVPQLLSRYAIILFREYLQAVRLVSSNLSAIEARNCRVLRRSDRLLSWELCTTYVRAIAPAAVQDRLVTYPNNHTDGSGQQTRLYCSCDFLLY